MTAIRLLVTAGVFLGTLGKTQDYAYAAAVAFFAFGWFHWWYHGFWSGGERET